MKWRGGTEGTAVPPGPSPRRPLAPVRAQAAAVRPRRAPAARPGAALTGHISDMRRTAAAAEGSPASGLVAGSPAGSAARA